MSKIFLSMPCVNGSIHQKTLLTAQTISAEHEIFPHYIENCSLVTKARQDHFGMFMQKKFDYLLTLDADLVVGPPGILDGMISRCPENSIIGGLYAMKAHDEKGHAPVNGMALDPDEKIVLDGRLIQMRYIPSGFMLIPYSVAQKMVDHYPGLGYVDYRIGSTWALYNTMLLKDEKDIMRFLPEDFSFCERARSIGINLYADTNCILGHIGMYLYHLEHLRTQDNA